MSIAIPCSRSSSDVVGPIDATAIDCKALAHLLSRGSICRATSQEMDDLRRGREERDVDLAVRNRSRGRAAAARDLPAAPIDTPERWCTTAPRCAKRHRAAAGSTRRIPAPPHEHPAAAAPAPSRRARASSSRHVFGSGADHPRCQTELAQHRHRLRSARGDPGARRVPRRTRPRSPQLVDDREQRPRADAGQQDDEVESRPRVSASANAMRLGVGIRAALREERAPRPAGRRSSRSAWPSRCCAGSRDVRTRRPLKDGSRGSKHGHGVYARPSCPPCTSYDVARADTPLRRAG